MSGMDLLVKEGGCGVLGYGLVLENAPDVRMNRAGDLGLLCLCLYLLESPGRYLEVILRWRWLYLEHSPENLLSCLR
jgi:hypothetical protein